MIDRNAFVHTGPGTIAGRYMRRFWQPVYVAEDLAAGDATPVKMYLAKTSPSIAMRRESRTPWASAARIAAHS